MLLRNLMMAALLLTLAACGCTDDTSPPGSTIPIVIPAVLTLKTEVPPIPVMPPPLGAIKIDVTFVMDDSDNMNNKRLGIIPNNPTDRRERMQAAQAIMRNLEQRITARVAFEYGANPVPNLDFAFAVVRYEDFGGSFTSPLRDATDPNTGAPIPITSNRNDMDARPFILNMPILRQNHPQFAQRFADAIARQAPGDGNPFVRFPPGSPDLFRVVDPQSGVEALYQLAAGPNTGLPGGFDADGVGGTLGSGPPTGLDPALNPQTAPGATGDVPLVGFAATTDDPDGRPQFNVTDEGGTVVMIPDPNNAAVMVPSVASGNIGGVGWRPDAARFVILATDIGTVAPTNAVLTGTPEAGGVLPPPDETGAGADFVTSSDGAPDAPRQATSDVLLAAFDAGVQILPGGFPLTQRRTGEANGATHQLGNGVAPTGAHTVQETIDALNALDIEVLLMGAPFLGGLDTKPGVPGVNGDGASDISADLFDPNDPADVRPDMAPWFWMNSVSRLTTPEITSLDSTGAEALFRGVYNIGTIWPLFDKTTGLQITDVDGLDESTILDTINDDLAERIRNWVDGGFVTGGGGGARPPLPTVFYDYELVLTPGAPGDVIQVAPLGGGGNPITSFLINRVQIPTYWSDEARPADVTVSFPLAGQTPFTYTGANDSVPLPASDTIQFEINTAFDSLGNTLPSNAIQQQQIRDFIIARGDGVNPAPLATEFIPIIQGAGTYLVTVRNALFPGPGGQLSSVTRGCAIVNDLTAGQSSADQQGGTCPFPPSP